MIVCDFAIVAGIILPKLRSADPLVPLLGDLIVNTACLLAAGSRLGAYEIVALIGAGGMGEVYRARDTKLKGSPNQINLQVRDNATTGSVSVVVTNINGTATSTVSLSPVAPALLLFESKYAAGEIPCPTRPAHTEEAPTA
jgi:serine/threonine protein kinase